MTDRNTQHSATDTSLQLAWVSALVQSTDPETAPIKQSIVEAARIIACAKVDIANSAKTGRNLPLKYLPKGIGDKGLRRFFMDDAIDRAREALLSVRDEGDSVSGLINYDAGPSDGVGRKQCLLNVLSLFQNIWICEEVYLGHGDWERCCSINFHLDRLMDLMDDAVFSNTDDVTIIPVSDDVALASFNADDLGNPEYTLAKI